MKKENLEERLRKQPVLRARVEALLDMVEDQSGQLERADDAEEFFITQLRCLGQEVLQAWATNQQQPVEHLWDQRPGVARKQKKTLLASPLRQHRSGQTTLSLGTPPPPNPLLRATRRGGVPPLFTPLAARDG